MRCILWLVALPLLLCTGDLLQAAHHPGPASILNEGLQMLRLKVEEGDIILVKKLDRLEFATRRQSNL